MADNFIRQSQVVTSFGPGAMLDLPDRSVMIGGLNMWSSSRSANGWRPVTEPRLTSHLERALNVAQIELRTPPEHDRNARFAGPFVGAVVFPLWFVCDQVEDRGKSEKRRRLLPWSALDPGNRKTFRDEGKAQPVTPVRFVAACDRGHIQDVDWKWVVHRGEKCSAPLYLEERGTSGDTRDTAIVCGCGKRFLLAQAYVPAFGGGGPLGRCGGHRPWLGEEFREECTEPLKLLHRTATNAYFSHSLSVISIPLEQDELTRLVEKHYDSLRKAPSAAIIAFYRDANSAIAADFADYTDQEVFDAVASVGQARTSAGDANPKDVEFEALTSGRRVIGANVPGAMLYAETLPRTVWDTTGTLGSISSVVAVHRLREVTCQHGFSRFESAMGVDDRVEENDLAVQIAKIADPITWLPAVEQFGEGLFIQFDTSAVATWAAKPEVRDRFQKLEAGHKRWTDQRYAGKRAPAFRGGAYYLAHSISHALMAQIALECGYPQSALKERIYSTGSGGLGLLIYTAAGDAEGTLGGLVNLASCLDDLMARALESAKLCSNDPICSDHDPSLVEDDRHLHGAACHGCLLTAETSCESRNDFLDRSLLVEGLEGAAAAFFS